MTASTASRKRPARRRVVARIRRARGRRRAGRLRRRDRGEARGLLGHADRALSLSRRARVRRHGAGARRHAQRRRRSPSRGLCMEMIERMAKRRRSPSIRRTRSAARASRCAANGRAGACFDFRSQMKPQPIVYGRRVRSRRLEARLERDDRARPASTCGCIPGSRKAIVQDGRIRGVDLRDQGGPPGDPGRRGHRRHRRSRRRRRRRRAVHRTAPTSSPRCSASATSIPTRPSASQLRGAGGASPRSTGRPSASWAAPGTSGGSRRRCPASCGATART